MGTITSDDPMHSIISASCLYHCIPLTPDAAQYSIQARVVKGVLEQFFMLDQFDPGPVRSVALWETIVEPLRKAIILGELAPGLRLEEVALARKFQVSRIPVREALTRLEREGLVRIEPRRGAFVVGVSPRDIHDIYEIRRFLELTAIRKVAEHPDPIGRSRLHALLDSMAEAIRQDVRATLARLDLEFHRQIVVSAGSAPLLAAWSPIGDLLATILSITNALRSDLSPTQVSHQAMVDAIVRHDADAAVSLLRTHLESGEQTMRDALVQVSVAEPLAPSIFSLVAFAQRRLPCSSRNPGRPCRRRSFSGCTTG